MLRHAALVSKKHFVFLRSVRRLLGTANVVPSTPILVTMMIEAISSSELSVLTRPTRHNIPEDGILRFQCRFLLGLNSDLKMKAMCSTETPSFQLETVTD
jgi:hypothetical protein